MMENRFRDSAFMATAISMFVLSFVAAQLTSSASAQSPAKSQEGGDGNGPSIFEPRVLWPPVTDTQYPAIDNFFDLLGDNRVTVFRALSIIETKWHPGNRAMLLEMLRFARNPIAANGIVNLLQRKSGQKIGQDLGAWYRTVWKEPYSPHPKYTSFKARLYEQIDPRFRDYFVESTPATIRLDEIRWGGVRRDGIPPLKNPATLSAKKATYLADSDIVFGVEIGGEARAYPKRVLAWHEMVKDVVGGVSINGVYCTLCGSMIVYRTTTADGTHYELGTSGFLYRSNKLMYDTRTKSLWSTIKGKPVVGELVGEGIKLEPHYVVTTTWGKWKAEHPKTRVLSLNTGHRRDYGEGVAYREYFATDNLMFDVPRLDQRLKNKDEVFIIRGDQQEPLAISLRFLQKHSVYHNSLGPAAFVVITDATGANRAYSSGLRKFTRIAKSGNVLDTEGMEWAVSEQALVSSDGSIRLARLPSHRAFWFGWYAAHPNTRLVK